MMTNEKVILVILLLSRFIYPCYLVTTQAAATFSRGAGRNLLRFK